MEAVGMLTELGAIAIVPSHSLVDDDELPTVSSDYFWVIQRHHNQYSYYPRR